MKFTAERDALLSALGFVARYVDSNKSIPILNDVKVVAADGKVSLTGTNVERDARDSIAADVDQAGELCAPAQLLLKAVKSAASGSEVSFAADDKTANVSVGKLRLRLPVMPAADFPEGTLLSSGADCEFTIPADLLAGVRKTVTFAREPDGGRYALTGTCWREGRGGIQFCATSGKAISILDSGVHAAGIPEIIVPDFDMPAWTGAVTVAVSARKFIRFTCGSQALASKLLDATYPDLSRLVPTNPIILLFDRAQLLDAVSRAAMIATKSEQSILMVGRDGVASIMSETANEAVSDEVPFEGSDFQIAFAHAYLAPILASFDCENIEVRIGDHASPATFHKPGDSARVTLALPFMDRRLTDYLTAIPVAEAAE